MRIRGLFTKKRIITCVGPIQLVSAIAAIKSAEQKHQQIKNSRYQNILVLYNLSAPPERQQFAIDTLSLIARTMLPIDSIVFIDQSTITATYESRHRYKKRRIEKNKLEKLFAYTKADEIWVNSDFDNGNKILVSFFKKAKIICYGDGPGIYFTHTCDFFFKPPYETFLVNRIKATTIRQQLSIWRRDLITFYENKKEHTINLRPIEFEEGYLLFPDSFGEIPYFPFWRVPDEVYRQVVKEASARVVSSGMNEILSKIEANQKLVLLMTTNMSEAQRMTMEDEISGYLNLIASVNMNGGTVLVKPHPRDSSEKIEYLLQTLENHALKVFSMNQPDTQYFPFEFFIYKLLDSKYADVNAFASQVTLLTTSTACMTVAKLFGLKSRIGFGTEFIQKHIFPDLVESRIKHDYTLQSIVDHILENTNETS